MKLYRIPSESVPTDRCIDAGIITIIPKEVEALFRVFGIDPKESANITRPLDYWQATIPSHQNHRDVRVVITFLSGTAGNTESGITTAFFLRDWHPRIMCLAGIAAGTLTKAKIGDVVIPDKIHDVCVRVITEAGALPRDDLRHRDTLIDRMLKIRGLNREQLNKEVAALLGPELIQIEKSARDKGLSASEFNLPLEVLDGSLVSGNNLLRDSGYLADMNETKDEKCRGGEMEGAGFARA